MLELIRELAEYEREPQAAVARPEDLLRDGFGGEPKFRALIAEWSGEPAGFEIGARTRVDEQRRHRNDSRLLGDQNSVKGKL